MEISAVCMKHFVYTTNALVMHGTNMYQKAKLLEHQPMSITITYALNSDSFPTVNYAAEQFWEH